MKPSIVIAISSVLFCLASIGSPSLRAKETKIASYGSDGYIPDSMPLKISKLLANADEPVKRIKVIGCLVTVLRQKSRPQLYLVDQISKKVPEPAIAHSIELITVKPLKMSTRGAIDAALKERTPELKCVCVEGELLASNSAGSIRKFRCTRVTRMSEYEFHSIDDALDCNVGDFDPPRHRFPDKAQ